MRYARRTGVVRRIELVRVAQLALVLEVVDSARARQVGGHVDALAAPAVVGRGQSVGSITGLARQMRGQRAGSGRQRAGRAGAPTMSARFQHFDPEESRTCGIHCTCTLGIQDPVNPALLPKKVGANGEPFAHRTDIFFTRTHNRGISLRRRYLLPPEADNQWAGRTSSPFLVMDVIVPSQVVQGKYLDIPGGDISPTSWTSNTSG